MSGELQLNNAAAAAPTPAAAAPIQAQPVAPAGSRPTPIVELKHMLTQQDLDNDEEFKEIMEDTRDECSSFGLLKNVIIPRSGPGATKIFLEYTTPEDAAKAIAGLAGRTFDGRQVVAAYFDPVKFQNQDFS
jgi:splicing factor U2AF subunit